MSQKIKFKTNLTVQLKDKRKKEYKDVENFTNGDSSIVFQDELKDWVRIQNIKIVSFKLFTVKRIEGDQNA